MATDEKLIRIGVILAGGSGERFWPLSRQSRPKQLLHLTHSERSMLHEAVELYEGIVPRENLYISTQRDLIPAIKEADTGVREANIIGEPAKRNTAGALVYVIAQLMAKYGDDADNIVMAVTTADHRIGDPKGFCRSVNAMMEYVSQQPALGVIGIRPTRPETGYGYIEVEENGERLSANDVDIFRVTRFREKPDATHAEEWFRSGRWLWNSGMFFWRLTTFFTEGDRFARAWTDACRLMTTALKDGDKMRADEIFKSLGEKPIDKALMEVARRVVVTPADFTWDDIGAWDSYYKTRPPDTQGNVLHGDPVLVDCQHCIVYNDAGAEDMAVAVVGAENMAVIVTKDGVLVAPRNRAQDVKMAVEMLRERGAKQI